MGVIGGGTAGYFAALAIRRRFPDLPVTLVESRDVPIIGVGEATTTLMPPFLHAQLGIGMPELFRDVRPTFKLGIRFEWGPSGGHFNYPFGDADPIEAVAFDGDLATQSLVSMMMDAGSAPVLRGPDGEIVSLLTELKFAYHLDNAPFVGFLARIAARAGVAHEEMTIATVTRGEQGVESLVGTDGRRLSFDLYVDASGFRSLLVEGALASPFESYASSLFCDRAIVGALPHGGRIRPYTTAETMDAGWCWRIPVGDEDHRGYVFSSSFLGEAEAEAEMRAKNPGLGETHIVRFRSGRHRDFWHENVVAVGNAYGFVEPLESTALHMVIVELGYLLAGLGELADGKDAASVATFPRFASDAVGAHWDYLRWFLALHYKYNERKETPFWRGARSDVDTSGLAPLVDRFRSAGPWMTANGREFEHGDPTFGFSGAMLLLLGQRVKATVTPRPDISPGAWRERVDKQRGVLRWALPHAEALAVLAARHELLDQCGNSPRSWCQSDAERVTSGPLAARTPVHPRSGMPAADDLLRAARPAGR